METNEWIKETFSDKAEEAAAAFIGRLNGVGDMEFGYSDFLAICVDEDEQEDNYLGFYRIDRKVGLFTQDIPDDIRSSLTSTEASILSEHPLRALNKPILPFPFTAAQLKAFIQWSANRGIEIPVDVGALSEAIAKNRQEEAQASALRQGDRQNKTVNESDAALGAYIRHQNQKFAEKQRDNHAARDNEWQRWRDTAEKIQQEMTRDASKRELAELVKKRLGLEDSIETIRKRL